MTTNEGPGGQGSARAVPDSADPISLGVIPLPLTVFARQPHVLTAVAATCSCRPDVRDPQAPSGPTASASTAPSLDVSLAVVIEIGPRIAAREAARRARAIGLVLTAARASGHRPGAC